MASITYGSIQLPYPQFTEFSQESVYDDGPGRGHGSAVRGTDWYCTRYNIKVQCLVNTDYASLFSPGLATSFGNPADIMRFVYHNLMQPRQQLSVKFNGVEFIPQKVGNNPGTVDVQNGPQPKSCTYLALTNNLFILVYHIVAHYWENIDNVGVTAQGLAPRYNPGNPVLTNRWSETVDIDNYNYSRRHREGKFIIRSDNVEGLIADQLREKMAVVSIPPGFLRESAQYTVSPDGLGIHYSITDREVYMMPPEPAFTAEGDYIETVGRTGLGRRWGMCWVRLKGSKETDRGDLLKAATTVVCAKLATRGNALPPGRWNLLESAELRLKLYDNEVEFRARVMIAVNLKDPPGKQNNKQDGIKGGQRPAGVPPLNPISAFNGIDTTTPASSKVGTYTPNYSSRGTASLLLQAAAYYDPSLRDTVLGAGTTRSPLDTVTNRDGANVQMTHGLQPGRAGVQREA